ncbi:MAG: hypothetical protein ABH814_00865, partial [bacterium]
MAQSIGTGLASIRVPQTLVPGQVYKLPLWPVINTGETEACFRVKADPESTLLNFNPRNFCLMAGDIEQVKVELTLPLKEPQGKREFVLEAQTVLPEVDGASGAGSQVGAAVGTKLYFEVGQSPGILGAAMQRVNSLYQYNFGLVSAISVILCLLLAALLARRAFDFKVKLRK